MDLMMKISGLISRGIWIINKFLGVYETKINLVIVNYTYVAYG